MTESAPAKSTHLIQPGEKLAAQILWWALTANTKAGMASFRRETVAHSLN